MAHLYGSGGKQLASSLLADNLGQIVLARKRNNRFGGARGMAVHEENRISVELFAAQPLRLKYDGCLGQHRRRKLQCEKPERLLGSGDGMEPSKPLLLRIQIGRNAPSVEGEPYRIPVGREQAHDAKGSDPSSGISAEVDNEPVYLPQPRDGTGDFVRHLDSDHPREHRNLQVAQTVFEMPCLNQRWLGKMGLFALGPHHIDRNGSSLIVSADNLQSSFLAHSEDRMLWRRNLPAIHTEKNIPWFDSGIGCGAS